MEKAKAGDLFAKTPTSSNRRAGSLGLPMQVPGGGSRSCPYVCSLEHFSGGIMATEKLSYSRLGEATELLTGEHCGNRAVTGW
jgi:hypothetical protein